MIGLVLLAGACSTTPSGPAVVTPGEGDTAWSPEPSDAPRAVSEDERLLARFGPPPLDAFAWSAEESDTVTSATGRLITSCMAGLGFEYVPEVDEEPSRPVTHWGDDLGLIDPAAAAVRGYQAVGLAEPPREPVAGPEQSAEYYAALVEDGGCVDQAFDATLGSPVEDRDLLGRLWADARAAAQADSDFLDAKDVWRRCVADAGFPLDDFPMPFANDVDDIAQAVADVTCKQTSGVTDAYVAALYAAEERLAERHAEALADYRSWMDERVRLAAGVAP